MIKSIKDLPSFIKEQQRNFQSEPLEIFGVEVENAYNEIKMGCLYNEGLFTEGQYDEDGNPYPFDNITKPKVLTEYRATDVDRKDLFLSTDDPNFMYRAMLFSKANQNYLKKDQAAAWLNDMGWYRSLTGTSILKKSMKGDELNIEVLETPNIIFDQHDIDNGVIIIPHELTPDKIMANDAWDLEARKKAIKIADEYGYSEDGTKSTKKKGQSDRTRIYEVHGVLPETLINEDADEYSYKRQVWFVAGVEEAHDAIVNQDDNVIVLFKDTLDESPFKVLRRNKRHGCDFGCGVPRDVRQNQQQINNALYLEYRSMILAGKHVFQGPTGNGMADNLASDVEDGEYLEYSIDPIQRVDTNSYIFPQVQVQVDRWKQSADKIANTGEAISGDQIPSGVAFRTLAVLNREGNSLFLQYIEEIGIFLDEVWQDWVIPYLRNKLSNKHVLTSEFSFEELQELDKQIFEFNLRKRAKEAYDRNELVDENKLQQELEEMLSSQGNLRSVEIPEDFFDGFDVKLHIDVSNERINKAIELEVFGEMLGLLRDGQILADPVSSQIFFKLAEATKVLSAGDIQLLQSQAIKHQQAVQQGHAQQQPQASGGSQTPEFNQIVKDQLPTPELAPISN